MAFAMLLSSAIAQNQAPLSRYGDSEKEPKVFTVVYATSEDGFLNVREGASMKNRVLTK